MHSPAEPQQLWTWSKFLQTFPTATVKGNFQRFATALGQILSPCIFRSRIIKEPAIFFFLLCNGEYTLFYPSSIFYCHQCKKSFYLAFYGCILEARSLFYNLEQFLLLHFKLWVTEKVLLSLRLIPKPVSPQNTLLDTKVRDNKHYCLAKTSLQNQSRAICL